MASASDIASAMQMVFWMKGTVQEARYAIAAMFTLQVYEWVAGVEQEARLIHRARWTLIKTLYLLCRYYPLFLWIVILWAYVGDHTAEECIPIVRPLYALIAPCQFFAQAVMVMRAFAFAGRDRRLLVLLGSCYLALVGINVWTFCTEILFLPSDFLAILVRTGCFPNYGDPSMALRLGWSMLGATLMDLISLSVVVIYCLRTRARDISLARYFINQGLTAFALISAVNVATAVAFFRPPTYHTSLGLPIIMVISNLVACRLILQLREKVNPTATQLDRNHSCIVREALASRRQDLWTIVDEDCCPTLPS